MARHEDGPLLDGEEAARRWIASNTRHSMTVRAQNPGVLRRWIDEYEDGRLADSIGESDRLWSKLRTGASLAKLAQRHNVSVGFETEHGQAMILGSKIWHGRYTVLGTTLLAVLCAGIWWLFGGFLRAAFSGVMWFASSDALMWICGAVIVL